jgi:hypothetical protein
MSRSSYFARQCNQGGIQLSEANQSGPVQHISEVSIPGVVADEDWLMVILWRKDGCCFIG